MTSPQVMALFEAVKIGDIELLRVALARGAPVDSRHKCGQTPLMVASWNGHLGIAAELLAAGADINARSSDQLTALAFAAWGGQKSMMKFLIARGADVLARDGIEQNLLHHAAVSKSAEVVQLALEFGLPINEFDLTGHSPLQLAREEGSPEIVQIFLQAGAVMQRGGSQMNTQSLFEYIEGLKSNGDFKPFSAILIGTIPELVELHTPNGNVLGSGCLQDKNGVMPFLVRPNDFEHHKKLLFEVAGEYRISRMTDPLDESVEPYETEGRINKLLAPPAVMVQFRVDPIDDAGDEDKAVDIFLTGIALRGDQRTE